MHVGGGGGGAGGIKGSGGNVGGPAGSKEMGNKDVDKKRKGQTGWEIEGLNGGGLPEGWQGEGSKRKATVAQGEFRSHGKVGCVLTLLLRRYRELHRATRRPVRLRPESAPLPFSVDPFFTHQRSQTDRRRQSARLARRTRHLVAPHHADESERRETRCLADGVGADGRLEESCG